MAGDRTARLDTAAASLAITRDAAGRLSWRHLGTAMPAAAFARPAPSPPPSTFTIEGDAGVPVLPGTGEVWFGPSCLELRGEDGCLVAFSADRTALEDNGAQICATAFDDGRQLVLTTTLSTLPGGAIRIETALRNDGEVPITVARLASASFPVPPECSTILSWRGHHAAEWTECREPLPEHGWYRETRLGVPGHGGPPGFYLCPPGLPYDAGLTVACQLAWSGDSRIAIERLADGGRIALLEAVFQPDEMVLSPGEHYTAPAVLLAISDKGRNGAMAKQHDAVRSLVNWPDGSMAPRPVHLNSWEACYFAHDEARISELAAAAAALGVERFVLDDGWFAGRSDDRRALGDWVPDAVKYPNGLAPLAQQVEAMGMEFGLWVEPEMVSPESDLYRAHPDWALAVPGCEGPLGRNQLVLDMRRTDVRDYLFTAFHKLLSEAPIRYLKWDHNRAHAPSGGAAQVEGAYALLARLRAAHPYVEIESCASGGGRCDAGIAPFVHRFWTSDNLDAVSRVGIQRGFAAFLPPEMMGAHVGASPAHATGRRQSLAFRAAVACMGHFGLELDPRKLSDKERDELAGWIEFYKHWRDVIHGGALRLGESNDGLLWQAHGDGRQWLLFAIRMTPLADRRPQPLSLPFAADEEWRVRLLRLAGENRWLGSHPWLPGENSGATECEGASLAAIGLPVPQMAGEAVAIFHLEPAA